MKNSELKIE